MSDIVRIDSGILAEPRLALAAPIGSLSSEVFFQSIRDATILESAAGWQDARQISDGIVLLTLSCAPPAARCSHRVDEPTSLVHHVFNLCDAKTNI